MKRPLIQIVLPVCLMILPRLATASETSTLTWDKNAGVVWRTPVGTFRWDVAGPVRGPSLQFASGAVQPLANAGVRQPSPARLEIVYRQPAPGGGTVEIVREIVAKEVGGGHALIETFTLRPSRPISIDLQISHPFAMEPATRGLPLEITCPLKNGWARRFPLSIEETRAEYRLGNPRTGKETQQLAIPMIGMGSPQQWTGAVMADPAFSSLYQVRRAGGAMQGSLSYRYAGSRVPISGEEKRVLGVWLAPGGNLRDPFAAVVDAMFTMMLPDVPPGPAWLHEIAMVDYDYLSDKGLGWEKDVRLLAEWLTPAERRRTALCLHGWYDALGLYCFDASAGQMKTDWLAFGPSQKIRMTQGELKRRLRLARDLGFRVLLYFGDGMTADSRAAGYRDDWIYRDPQGKPISGWQGPDTFGPTFWLNPAHPGVFSWFLGYMDALLKTYGADLDGLVWDETFECRVGQIATKPQPAYCDRAMLALVKELSARVHKFDPQKVFLASDCIGINGWEDVPGYAMVAHGTYQDTACQPVAWSYGLFPNWRNTLWSCNWGCVSNFAAMRWGVEHFGVPVAISNGWGDDRGPWEWTPKERELFLTLFRQRAGKTSRVRYLTEDPQALLARGLWPPAPGDPLPAPVPGQANWALANNGARASASSSDPAYPPQGAIDGVRDDLGWGAGHGWVSAAGWPLPQWVQVDFGQARQIQQVIVITYQRENSPETATKWGIEDYEIQAWDAATGRWTTVASEARGRAVKVRVHCLDKPLRTDKLRLTVSRVAAPDASARLLQFEAWGPEAR
jgi:hypothetical protein